MYHKYVKRISALTLSLLAIVLLSGSALATSHREAVLGSSTDLSQINFPPVTAGPGLILPDSPFYFLDEFKQGVKLTLSMGPRTRSITHLDIAGERLAELRVMIQRGNMQGISIALMGISSETQKAVDDMADANAQGKDVEKLAKDITAHIKITREILKNVSDQADKDLSLSLEASRENLRNAKIFAENYLPQPDLENEIADNILERLDQNVLGAKTTTSHIQIAADEYQKMASDAAQRTLQIRQKGLDDATASNDKEKINEAKEELDLEVKKGEKTAALLQELFEQAETALQKGAEASQNYEKARQQLKNMKLEGN